MMRDFMPKGVYDESVMTEELIELYLKPWSTEDGKQAFFRNLRRLNKEYTQAIADELSNLPHQTLIMWGDKDPFQKPEYAPKLAEAIPNAELVWIKDVGHWLINEKPTEISDHLNEFLS
jgi:pimeloyl-ACP methyl ester carboxylesterase